MAFYIKAEGIGIKCFGIMVAAAKTQAQKRKNDKDKEKESAAEEALVGAYKGSENPAGNAAGSSDTYAEGAYQAL